MKIAVLFGRLYIFALLISIYKAIFALWQIY